MWNRNRVAGAALLSITAIFLIGVVQLFLLRFEAGDVYPPYSSLRADRFGSRALYESLEAIPGVTVTRNLKPLTALEGVRGVVFYAGVDPWTFRASTEKTLESMEAVLRHGARLIVAFQPKMYAPMANEEIGVIGERWGARLVSAPSSGPASENEDLPRQTLLYFDHLDRSWEVLYRSTGHPTAIVRLFGKGSIALVANGYLLSNEALLESRDTKLLTSLIRGPENRFTFDEYHLGISETSSVAALARKYGLTGLAAGLALLFGLFVWQSSVSFLPPRDEIEEQILGKSAASGFVNLLRRGVPRAGLLALCAKEWRRSLALGPHVSRGKEEQIEGLAAAGADDPLGTYQRMSRILGERKKP